MPTVFARGGAARQNCKSGCGGRAGQHIRCRNARQGRTRNVTSKHILNEGAKILKTNAVVEMALKDTVNQSTADIAAFAKTKTWLRLSRASTKEILANVEGKIKKPNENMTVLEKNGSVMKAPTDAKVYEKLQNEFTESVKTAVGCAKNLDAAIKRTEGML